MGEPFFSIITVCYNAGDGLCRAVEDLRMQTCSDYEHVIKDGGSTDGSVDAARALIGDDTKTLLLSSPDGGIYDAMNAAVREARGKYIFFLNCGDCFYDSRVLEDVKRFIEAQGSDGAVNPHGAVGISVEDAIVYGDFALRGEVIRQPRRVDGAYFYRRPLNHQSMFFGRGVFVRHGEFDTAFTIRADHELTLRAYRGGTLFKRIDRVISTYEGGGFSEGSERMEARKNELIMLRERHFSDAERKKYGRSLRCRLSGAASRLRSENAPEWVRRLYRGAANFFNR